MPHCFRIVILSVVKLTEIYWFGDWANICGFLKPDIWIVFTCEYKSDFIKINYVAIMRKKDCEWLDTTLCSFFTLKKRWPWYLNVSRDTCCLTYKWTMLTFYKFIWKDLICKVKFQARVLLRIRGSNFVPFFSCFRFTKHIIHSFIKCQKEDKNKYKKRSAMQFELNQQRITKNCHPFKTPLWNKNSQQPLETSTAKNEFLCSCQCNKRPKVLFWVHSIFSYLKISQWLKNYYYPNLKAY